MAGQVILLNGASSSGKSSIAREVQARIGAPFWHWSIDHLRDAGVLPRDRIRSGEFPWPPQRKAFFEGFHRSIAAFALPGANLIVEHIVETPAWMARLVELLDGVDVFFVGIHCPLAELERRERARGDRPIGDAARDFHSIHQHCVYDLELDSTQAPAANAERLIAAWTARSGPTAFEGLRATSPPF